MGIIFLSVLVLLCVIIYLCLVVYRTKNKGKMSSLGEKENGQWIFGIGIGTIVCFVGLIIVTVTYSLTQVPAGYRGVIDLFGSVKNYTLEPGLRWKNPFAKMIPMSVQTQELKEDSLMVPSQEGLIAKLDVSIIYHLDPSSAEKVYKNIGVGYENVVIHPYLRSVTRNVTGSYNAESLYSGEKRKKLEIEIFTQMSELLSERGIIVEGTPIRDLDLPKKLLSSIEDKLSMDQQAKQMEFVINKEKKEAERKKIEAGGIADFQRIVTEGISEPLLKWKGIEATIELSKSHNSKIVIIGAGKEGLPLILGSDTWQAPNPNNH